MTLQASGQISFNDIRVELTASAQSPFSITDAATGVYVTINTNSPSYPNASAPHAISEWYSYNHNAGGGGPTCQALNSGTSLRYSTTTPASPDTCNGVGNEYTNSQVFYAFDDVCTVIGVGCTVYADNTCTALAYTSVTARYITDDTNYFVLNSSSVVSSTAGCSD